MRYIFTVLSFLSAALTIAQNPISGRVLDAKSKESLPFVHITGPNLKGLSDIQGLYSLTPSPKNTSDSVVFSLIGYEKLVVSLESLKAKPNILMTAKAYDLSTVTIVAKEDPAYAMIRKAVRQRKANDPENLEKFEYYAYNKAYADIERTDTIQAELDSTNFAEAHFMMMESATRVSFIQPNMYREEVLGNQISGFRNPSLILQSNTFQPFSTYSEFLDLLGFPFLNPLSPGSDKTYTFQLMDSVSTNGRLTYVIAFEPKKKKSGNLLEGVLSLDAQDWAIANLQFNNSGDYKLADFEIRQSYTKESGFWFPNQSNTHYRMFVADEEAPVLMVSNTYIDSVKYDGIDPKSMGITEIAMEPMSIKLSPEEWNSLRVVPLSTQEENVYSVYDTLDLKILNTMDWVMAQSNALAKKSVSLGAADILLPHLFGFNQYEGLRLGLGLAANEKFIKWMRPEGYFAYGFRDKTLKYGGGLRFFMNPDRDFELYTGYKSDVDEPGRSTMNDHTGFSRIAEVERDLFIRNMNNVEVYEAQLSYRPFRGLRTTAFFNRELREFSNTDPLSDSSLGDYELLTTEVGILFEFNPKERLMRLGNTLVHRKASYPRMQLEIRKAIPDLFDGEQNYTRAEVRIAHQKNIRRLGALQLFTSAGIALGTDINSAHLFLSRGIDGEADLGILAFGYFHTLPVYRFMNDRYAHFGISQSFGNLFGFERKFTKPQIRLMYQAGIGGMEENRASIANTSVDSMDNFYLEGGLILDNIIRINQNTYYSGFGIGVFLNHGFYAQSDILDNLAFAISFTIDF